VHQGLTGHYKDVLTAYWQHTIQHLESDTHDYKMHQLPLARIKKVMKADPEVKMISAEAPILFAKGCDIFITELTMRAWIHAEENKRRTLQRSDIASALAKSDMFDFLIDIVPREEASSHAKRTSNQAAAAQAAAPQPQIPGVGAPNHAGQHPMAAPDYTLGGHNMGPEADYRQPQTMYPGQVQPGAPAYGQPQAQMYNVEDMYTYGTMPPQQVCWIPRTPHPPPTPNLPPVLPSSDVINQANSPSRAPRRQARSAIRRERRRAGRVQATQRNLNKVRRSSQVSVPFGRSSPPRRAKRAQDTWWRQSSRSR
jgi:histone H3/H4